MTLFIGCFVWFYFTARTLKRLRPKGTIWPEIFIALPVSYLALVGMRFSGLVPTLYWTLYFAYIVAIPICAIHLSSGINGLLGTEQNERYWIKSRPTILFGALTCIYMNYKMNRAREAALKLNGAQE